MEKIIVNNYFFRGRNNKLEFPGSMCVSGFANLQSYFTKLLQKLHAHNFQRPFLEEISICSLSLLYWDYYCSDPNNSLKNQSANWTIFPEPLVCSDTRQFIISRYRFEITIIQVMQLVHKGEAGGGTRIVQNASIKKIEKSNLNVSI